MEKALKQLIREAVDEALADLPQQQTTGYPAVLNIDQTAEYIGLGKSWIYQNKEDLPPRLSDKPIRYLRSDLDNWLEEQSQKLKSITPTWGVVNISKAK